MGSARLFPSPHAEQGAWGLRRHQEQEGANTSRTHSTRPHTRRGAMIALPDGTPGLERGRTKRPHVTTMLRRCLVQEGGKKHYKSRCFCRGGRPSREAGECGRTHAEGARIAERVRMGPKFSLPRLRERTREGVSGPCACPLTLILSTWGERGQSEHIFHDLGRAQRAHAGSSPSRSWRSRSDQGGPAAPRAARKAFSSNRPYTLEASHTVRRP